MKRIALPGTIRRLRTPWSQARGLMFRWPKKPFVYWFVFSKARRLHITMFFVFYPIDLIFLAADGTVVELKKQLKPFTHYVSACPASQFLEVPAGYVDQHKLELGMMLHEYEQSLVLLR